MEWFYSAKMELNDAFIQGYSHTLQTIQKSESFVILSRHFIHNFIRVLLATIRDQGICPCPRCLIPKSNLDQLGLIADSKNHIDKARKYDTDRVDKARNAIYLQGKPIGGIDVEQLLKASSAVPTSVSLIYIYTI